MVWNFLVRTLESVSSKFFCVVYITRKILIWYTTKTPISASLAPAFIGQLIHQNYGTKTGKNTCTVAVRKRSPRSFSGHYTCSGGKVQGVAKSGCKKRRTHLPPSPFFPPPLVLLQCFSTFNNSRKNFRYYPRFGSKSVMLSIYSLIYMVLVIIVEYHTDIFSLTLCFLNGWDHNIGFEKLPLCGI